MVWGYGASNRIQLLKFYNFFFMNMYHWWMCFFVYRSKFKILSKVSFICFLFLLVHLYTIFYLLQPLYFVLLLLYFVLLLFVLTVLWLVLVYWSRRSSNFSVDFFFRCFYYRSFLTFLSEKITRWLPNIYKKILHILSI